MHAWIWTAGGKQDMGVVRQQTRYWRSVGSIRPGERDLAEEMKPGIGRSLVKFVYTVLNSEFSF